MTYIKKYLRHSYMAQLAKITGQPCFNVWLPLSKYRLEWYVRFCFASAHVLLHPLIRMIWFAS
jgi:hypothetical protein